ncbi:hypothetical protein K438DRAFT_1883194, partial [Mycena galopus ATCC 62051]
MRAGTRGETSSIKQFKRARVCRIEHRPCLAAPLPVGLRQMGASSRAATRIVSASTSASLMPVFTLCRC